MVTSPCEKCEYLSDDRLACMFFVHKDVPFAEGIDFDGELPNICFVIGEMMERINVLLGTIEDISQELEKTQSEVERTAGWVEELWENGRGRIAKRGEAP